MDWLIRALSIQGIELQPVWPQLDWSGREDRSLSILASPFSQRLRASDQDPWDDPDSFEANQTKRVKGGCEGRDWVEPKAQMMFQLPFSPLPATATPPPRRLPWPARYPLNPYIRRERAGLGIWRAGISPAHYLAGFREDTFPQLGKVGDKGRIQF